MHVYTFTRYARLHEMPQTNLNYSPPRRDTKSRLQRFLKAYEDTHGYRPIECVVCLAWNLHDCHVWERCQGCGGWVCLRDYNPKEKRCADCFH